MMPLSPYWKARVMKIAGALILATFFAVILSAYANHIFATTRTVTMGDWLRLGLGAIGFAAISVVGWLPCTWIKGFWSWNNKSGLSIKHLQLIVKRRQRKPKLTVDQVKPYYHNDSGNVTVCNLYLMLIVEAKYPHGDTAIH